MKPDSKFPLKMPDPEALPDSQASLRDIIRFASVFDPTAHFQERWGDDYKERAQGLWRQCVESFKAGAPPNVESGELLLCLAYDCSLGPYLAVPEPHKQHFLHWLMDGLRKDPAKHG